jgi:hypothetical protein
MRNLVQLFLKRSPMMLLGLWLFSTLAAAEETAGTARVPLKSMSKEEYESYREQLQQQVNAAAAKTAEQGSAAAEDDAEKKEESKSDDSGYGRGYRARSERSGRTGSGYRGGSMSRGGGRGR